MKALTFKQKLLSDFQNRYVLNDFFNRYLVLYFILKIIAVTCLFYSSFASYSYYANLFSKLPYYFDSIIPFFITTLVSVLIYLLTEHVLKLWFSSFKVDVFIFVLIGLISFNVYTDLKGVEKVSENMYKKKEDKATSQLDSNYSLSVKDYNKRISVLHDSIKSKYSKWNDGKSSNWGAYNRLTRAEKILFKLQSDKDKLTAQYTKQRASSLSIYQKDESIRYANIQSTSTSLKGVATVCIIIVLLTSAWCEYYRKESVNNHLNDLNGHTTQRNERYNDSQRVGFVSNNSTLLNEYPQTVELLKKHGVNKAYKLTKENITHNKVYELSKILKR